jgi:trimeric autotransporter adhesin
MNGGSETVGGGNNNATSNYNSTISGGANNVSAGNASTVSGGSENNATGDHGAIGGGQNNLIQNGADHSTISGGNGDVIQPGAFESFIGGGQGNLIQTNSIWCTIDGGLNNVIQPGQSYATIGGGKINRIDYNGSYATICGGYENTASGQYSTVAGGGFNSASGNFSFAAGAGAAALSEGSFVWSDNSSGEIFADSGINTFNVRALGGVVFTSGQPTEGQANHTVKWAPGGASWSFSSDRNLKDRFSDVNVEGVLNKVSQLPVVEWSYKGYEQRHIGPMAQDFHRLFPLNDDDKMLEDADLHGVELAAIQGLNQKLEEQRAEDTELKEELKELKQIVGKLSERKN